MAPVTCLVLAGCTAVGKSTLAMRVAGRRPAEIISADSVAVYRGLDLGSAKPSRLWRAQVPHHLVGVADPALSATRPYTAGDFARDARRAIRDVADRGHLPIVCGGSGLYLRFLMDGHDQSDGARARPDSTMTAVVDGALSAGDWASAVAAIAARLGIDPQPLHQVQHGNRRRLLRTAQRLRTPPGPVRAPDDVDFRPYVLVRPRAVLYRAIDRRCEHMLQRGLLDEVAGLYAAGRLPPGSPPALAVGYRQALSYLDGVCALGRGQFDLAAFRAFLDDFQAASRQLARRQLTWFRSGAAFRFLDADRPDVLDRVLDEVDMERGAFDAAADADEQARLRRLSDDDRRQQRRYVPEPVIFKYGLGPDTILKLMAQDRRAIGAL